MNCPICRSTEIDVRYTLPASYRCKDCGQELRDANDPGVRMLAGDDAEKKRPALYGKPVCSCCSHAPHPEEPCSFCDEKPLSVKLVPR